MRFRTAGEVVAVHAEPAWAVRLVEQATGAPPEAEAGLAPTVWLAIEGRRDPFSLRGLRPVTRNAYADGRRVVLHDVGGSGFDLMLAVDDELRVAVRYRPSHPLRAANRVLRQRFALLAGQVLVHYPVLWRAGWRGRVPLHAAVLCGDGATPLLAGPAGVGKSTVLRDALAAGAVSTSDNLCCADADSCFGLAEPLRTTPAPQEHGRRTSHDRVSLPFADRTPALVPDRLVVLERGPVTELSTISPADAARALVAGTYAAGELRRYWAFAATLALATGRGPAHPPIAEVAAAYADRLPCRRVQVGDGERISIRQLCGEEVAS